MSITASDGTVIVTQRIVCSCGAVLAEPPWIGKSLERVIPNACPECAAREKAATAAKTGIDAIRAEDL